MAVKQSRVGKQVLDVLESSIEPEVESIEQRGPGRPPVHHEDYTKISVVLMNRQIIALDELAVSMRKQTGVVLRRAEIIRALADALIDSDIDISGATEEADLRMILTAALRRR